jgi:uncharacterized protein (TIGR02996 family)
VLTRTRTLINWPAEYTEFLNTQLFKGLGVPKELLQNRGVPTVLTPEQRRTRRGFLRDIRANPDDDAPRLIFADWLDDVGGDPDHATLIRVQCERAAKGWTQCSNRDDDPPVLFLCEGSDWTKKNARRCEYCRLVAEQDRVFWSWNASYLNVNSYPLFSSQWDRGFIFRVVNIDFDFWHNWGPRICQEHPVEKVGLAGVGTMVARVADRWLAILAHGPRWFESHYKLIPPPLRKTQEEATDHINHVLLSWAQCEAAKLDAAEDAKENDQ